MALVIAGDRSGSGKTTLTLALLAALRDRDPTATLQSFKVGPDYIDPMFHHRITGLPCRNLDPVLTSDAYVQACFTRHAQAADYAVVEGVMGLFDGASGTEDIASTAHIARLLNLPILLVIDCSRLSRSVAAIAHGYRSFDPQLQIAGVVLNRVGSDRHQDLLQSALASIQMPVLGVVRRQDAITIRDRHLGLVPTAELPELDDIFKHLTQLGHTSFDWVQLLPFLRGGSALTPTSLPKPLPQPLSLERGTFRHNLDCVRLAIAQDEAFSFYYADNLDLLRQWGAELVVWSPLRESLPQDIQGLYLGGGFPEMFAAQLMANHQARAQVRSVIEAGLPTYAECGGLMYLCDRLVDFDGNAWEMVGIFPTTVQMGDRLTLGYRCATARHNSPLLQTGESVWGHEFHRSHLSNLPDDPLYHLQGYDATRTLAPEGWHRYHVHASYVHLHWGATPQIPQRWLDQCWAFGRSRFDGAVSSVSNSAFEP